MPHTWLLEAYEKLKASLEEEGLFNETHKKKIPINPKIIGVLSSQTGAVIRDIINVSTRRNPNCYIRLLPVPVQGPGAAKEIVKENPELKIMDGILFQDRYGMIVQKGNDELKKQINKVLKRLIEEGKIDELILKYSK